MEPGIFDRELPHRPAGEILAVQRDGEAEMLAEHVALLVEGRGRRGGLATQERERLGKDPRVADRAAGHAHAVDARLAEHRHARLGRKQVA